MNRPQRAVIIDGYQVAWPGGRFVASGLAVTLSPGASIWRTARIDPDHGTLDNLTAKSVSATLLTVRQAP